MTNETASTDIVIKQWDEKGHEHSATINEWNESVKSGWLMISTSGHTDSGMIYGYKIVVRLEGVDYTYHGSILGEYADLENVVDTSIQKSIDKYYTGERQ